MCVCHLGSYFDSLPHHASSMNSSKPDLSRSPQLYEHTLRASLSQTDSFWQVPLSNSFQFGPPVLQENRECLVISCFFVPFSYMAFRPTLIQGCEVATFKPTVDLLVCQAGGRLVNSYLLPHFFKCHMNISTPIYTCIYVSAPTHMSILLCTQMSNSILTG